MSRAVYTVTGKVGALQLTIPADIGRRLGIRRGDKVWVTTDGARIFLTPLMERDRQELAAEKRRNSRMHDR